MSASNYANCPRCQRTLDGTVDLLTRRIADEYGKVTAAEYADLQEKLAVAAMRAKNGSRTFREDYGIYGVETGVVKVSYGGSCSECGLATSFDYEHEIAGLGGAS